MSTAGLLTAALLLHAAWAGYEHPIEQALAEAIRADAPSASLTLVFDDVHPLYGGPLFQLVEDGTLTRTDVQRYEQPPVVSRTHLDGDDKTALLAMLMGLEIWEQRVPDRIAISGESRAYLGLRLDGAESSIWEWANDLPDNKRLVQVQRWLDAQLPAGAP